MADLSATFAGRIHSPNPFWLASGPPTNCGEQVMRAFDAGWGGAVWKTLGEPIVNVTMRFQEGKQYFVNKITFVGNTTTRDNVIRREMQLVEGGVFNTESLKYSVRRPPR